MEQKVTKQCYKFWILGICSMLRQCKERKTKSSDRVGKEEMPFVDADWDFSWSEGKRIFGKGKIYVKCKELRVSQYATSGAYKWFGTVRVQDM